MLGNKKKEREFDPREDEKLDTQHLIEIGAVSKIYNEGLESEVRALEDITITIDHGEFVCFLGQSGSGKSTLMNILGCLDLPTYGTYMLNGTPVDRIKPSVLSQIRNREIGFIFQGFNLVSNLTAIENVELPLIYRGVKHSERRELARVALTEVGLGDRVNHLPAEMSGGQQQRVAIARAMAARPPIIMADEPTGNLDSKSGREIMERLRRLNDEMGTTVILITHDSNVAKLAKRIVTITDGHIVADHTYKGGELEV